LVQDREFGLDVAIDALHFARGRKRISNGQSSILRSYCDRIASLRHTWKALRDQGVAEECCGLGARRLRIVAQEAGLSFKNIL
jgi:hypothetical protein